jgi:hypothetical protein
VYTKKSALTNCCYVSNFHICDDPRCAHGLQLCVLTVEPLLDVRVEVVLALEAGLEGGAQAGRQLTALDQVPGHPT